MKDEKYKTKNKWKEIPLLTVYLLSFTFLLLAPYSPLEAQSTENLTITATVGGTSTTPEGGGGSGVGIGIPKTSVRFSGEAYPQASVTVLKNGKTLTSVTADKYGFFNITLEEKYDSTILYSLFARDISGNKSLLINYPLVVSVGYVTHLSGIRFPPTIVSDKIEVRAGEYLTVAGYALPEKELKVIIEDRNRKSTIYTLNARDTGLYSITIPTMDQPKGDYSAYIQYTADNRKSVIVNFIIGETNILSVDSSLNIPGDCNADEIINLVDFSVLAFWYKKPNPPTCVDTNKDGIVNLTDFSILAFYWTN